MSESRATVVCRELGHAAHAMPCGEWINEGWTQHGCHCQGHVEERRLDFLILTMPDREIVSLSLREGVDFLDEDWPEFGAFYILETA